MSIFTAIGVNRYPCSYVLAIVPANHLTVLDPAVIVIGGGFSKFDALCKELTERLGSHVLGLARVPRIVKAKYGDASGCRGAALLHYNSNKGKL